MTIRQRLLASAIVAVMAAAGLSGCFGNAAGDQAITQVPKGSLRLVAFNSCADALVGLRTAAQASVGPYGLPGITTTYGGVAEGALPPAAAGNAMSAPAPAVAPAYSGTNDHEVGVDEPDLVKTDGHRLVTVFGGVLRVVDAASRSVTGQIDLATGAGQYGYAPTNLLLDGDHALVLMDGSSVGYQESTPPTGGTTPITSPHLILVDLAGQPRVLATYMIDGGLVDARQIGDTARVVIRSTPRIVFPGQPGTSTDAQRISANKAIIAHADTSDWLPRFEVTEGGGTTRGAISCGAVQRPATYTGTNLLTVLTFNLAADTLGDGDGVTIVADGDTVYATGTSLYIASDQRWRTMPVAIGAPMAAGGAAAPTAPAAQPRTEIYRFDLTQKGRPRFVAGGSVPGYLVGQYAMSEWNGDLRVASTTGTSWAEADGKPAGALPSSSAIYVLATSGPVMRQLGVVDGLGAGERIYAVRFMGPIGYVVTFRQTDPLYTVDLSDPTRPRVRGALELTGYSAYLHPASARRLIGIGQQADSMGHVGGTQVSLFDVADLAAPSRLSTFAIAGGHSDAEFDPHAFLYWPAANLLVVPLQTYAIGGVPPVGDAVTPATPQSGVLLLHMDDMGITESGFISQPASETNGMYASNILRSLVIDQTLWTVSSNGVMATGIGSLDREAWIRFE